MRERPAERGEATDAIEAQAFTVTHRHCETCTCEVEPDRRTVHCLSGFLGADWDVADVLALVEKADELRWIADPLHHDLAVRVGPQVRRFAVTHPDREQS